MSWFSRIVAHSGTILLTMQRVRVVEDHTLCQRWTGYEVWWHRIMTHTCTPKNIMTIVSYGEDSVIVWGASYMMASWTWSPYMAIRWANNRLSTGCHPPFTRPEYINNNARLHRSRVVLAKSCDDSALASPDWNHLDHIWNLIGYRLCPLPHPLKYCKNWKQH